MDAITCTDARNSLAKTMNKVNESHGESLCLTVPTLH